MISINRIVEILNNSDILNDLIELTKLAIEIRKKNLDRQDSINHRDDDMVG